MGRKQWAGDERGRWKAWGCRGAGPGCGGVGVGVGEVMGVGKEAPHGGCTRERRQEGFSSGWGPQNSHGLRHKKPGRNSSDPPGSGDRQGSLKPGFDDTLLASFLAGLTRIAGTGAAFFSPADCIH